MCLIASKLETINSAPLIKWVERALYKSKSNRIGRKKKVVPSFSLSCAELDRARSFSAPITRLISDHWALIWSNQPLEKRIVFGSIGIIYPIKRPIDIRHLVRNGENKTFLWGFFLLDWEGFLYGIWRQFSGYFLPNKWTFIMPSHKFATYGCHERSLFDYNSGWSFHFTNISVYNFWYSFNTDSKG